MADKIFNKFKNQILSGNDVWSSSTIWVLLIDSSSTYAPADTQNFLSDAQGAAGWAELATTGYTAGGQALGGMALSRDDATLHGIKLTANNLTWNALGPAGGGKTIKAILIYIHTGVASTSDLIAYLDSGGSLALNGGNVTITWGANGVMTLT